MGIETPAQPVCPFELRACRKRTGIETILRGIESMQPIRTPRGCGNRNSYEIDLVQLANAATVSGLGFPDSGIVFGHLSGYHSW